MIYSS